MHVRPLVDGILRQAVFEDIRRVPWRVTIALPGQQLAAGRKRAWNARNTVTDNGNDWACINLLRVRRIESTELNGRRGSRGQYQAGRSRNETEDVFVADHERNSIEENWSKKSGDRQLDDATQLGFAIGRRFLKENAARL